MLYTHRNPSTELRSKSIDWLLYEWNIGIKWTNFIVMMVCITNVVDNQYTKACFIWHSGQIQSCEQNLCVTLCKINTGFVYRWNSFSLHVKYQFHAKLQNNSINSETRNIHLGVGNLSLFDKHETMLVRLRALATVNCDWGLV